MITASSEPSAPLRAEKDPILTLPFVSGGDGTRRCRYWSVKPSGDDRRDYERGVSYATATLQVIRATGEVWLLHWIVRDMKAWRYQKPCPVAAGFLSAFAKVAVAAAGGFRI